jgi:hypothetical protein
MRGRWWIGVASGVALGLGSIVAVDVATHEASAQASQFRVSAEQLRINQRISQAAVRRSNESLTLLGPVRDTDGPNGTRDTAPGWGASQIANGAVTQAKLAAEVTSKQPLWAVVNPDGTLARGSGATASGRASGFAAGVYTVTFNRTIAQCAYTATIGAPGTTPPTLGGQVLAYVNPNPNGQVITVRTFAADAEDDATPGAGDEEPGQTSSSTVDGDEEDRGFQLAVNC